MNKSILFPFVLVFLFSCTKIIHVSAPQISSSKIEQSSNIKPSQEVVSLILPYKKEMEKEMNQIVGTCNKELMKAKPESTLGNWTADLIHKKCEEYYGKPIDFAVVNYGGLRILSLPVGPITKSNIFELMPFENGLVVINVDAETIEKLFTRMAEYGGWPISHQVRFKIKNGKPINILINGKPIDKTKMYKIALSDFIANGGDKCFFFEDKKQELLGKLFRDAIMEYVIELNAQGKKIDANLEGRVEVVK
ncbi:5'-nucleotidase C-terminal domain-containing protein [Saprospiraceae bacterium]|jgi:2',3'-cyclic-nucleotide 2'-phosphodiesterase (5'-nucleotidase family)|nr:5'-nucleotidase C-terminal domain-containing protein [Saprospiraceae bacterium]MDG1435877.1 5'-nucleotidase [Saprospiraceae bacterium]